MTDMSNFGYRRNVTEFKALKTRTFFACQDFEYVGVSLVWNTGYVATGLHVQRGGVYRGSSLVANHAFLEALNRRNRKRASRLLARPIVQV